MGWKWRLKKFLVERKQKLNAMERMATRIGYMGAGFLVAGQWKLEPKLFRIGVICVIVQVSFRKQWNLVDLNLNGLVAWVKHLITNI